MNFMRKERKALLVMFAVLCVLALSLGMALVRAPARALAAEGDHADHTGWTEITADSGELSAGKYYLNSDVTLTTNLTFSGEVTLCLNGHVLTGNGNGSVITVNSGSNFTLCDCNSSEQTHYYTVDANGLYQFSDDLTADNSDGSVEGGVVTGEM